MRWTIGSAVALPAAALFMALPVLSSAAEAQSTPTQPGQQAEQPAQPAQQTEQPAQPQTSPSAGRDESPPGITIVSEQDRFFVHKVATGAMLQIALSKVAAEQTGDPQVRQFAQNTVDQFGKAAKKLRQIAGEVGISIPEQPPGQVQTLKDALAELEIGTLNRQYLALILPVSVVAVNMFEQEANDGANPKLVNFAQTMLPKIREHRAKVAELRG
ncbi:MAG: DUF4142 domain-containing protein [Alphaproteobacteria bacterium]